MEEEGEEGEEDDVSNDQGHLVECTEMEVQVTSQV